MIIGQVILLVASMCCFLLFIVALFSCGVCGNRITYLGYLVIPSLFGGIGLLLIYSTTVVDYAELDRIFFRFFYDLLKQIEEIWNTEI